jgi:hypothetical protein
MILSYFFWCPLKLNSRTETNHQLSRDFKPFRMTCPIENCAISIFNKLSRQGSHDLIRRLTMLVHLNTFLFPSTYKPTTDVVLQNRKWLLH